MNYLYYLSKYYNLIIYTFILFENEIALIKLNITLTSLKLFDDYTSNYNKN